MQTAFVFPGQGSQYPGMGRALCEQFSRARHLFEEANDALGFDLRRLCFEGPEDELKLTANTQPAILTVSVAAFEVLAEETGLQAQVAAGHSLGEYSALVAAGALSFADAVRTVRLRGRFMQEAVPVGTGAMAAVMGLQADQLEQVCREAAQGEVVSPANFNSPGQIVIAGHVGAVARAVEIAKREGAKRALPLPVSAPFHCALMQPAADRLRTVLEDIQVAALQMPVVTNVEAEPNRDAARVKNFLVQQVCAPVRWDESVERMLEMGVGRFVEIGPGRVLSGLIKRLAKNARIEQVEDPEGLAAIQAA